MEVLLVVHLVMIGVLVLLGFLFRAGKGAFLIAGYNTMSPAEKARYDEKKLCKVMGNFMFVLALLWIPVAAGSVLDNMILNISALVLFIAVVLVGGFFVNKAANNLTI